MGLRFDRSNQLLEYIRRAMELRRSSASSWEDHDVWRAVDDHIMVSKNSKVKLDRRVQFSVANETFQSLSHHRHLHRTPLHQIVRLFGDGGRIARRKGRNPPGAFVGRAAKLRIV